MSAEKLQIWFTILLASAWHLVLSEDRVSARSRFGYPDPTEDFAACGRQSKSFICDPDHLIATLEAEQLNTQIVSTVNETKCPCSHYSCSRNPGGFKIAIALLKRIQPDEAMFYDDELTEQELLAKKRVWTLEEAKRFTQHLLKEWKFGYCTETVVVFYSLYDSVLYAAAGDVARANLNHSQIHSILTNARSQFEPDGNLFKGLLKIVKDFRSVFSGTYQPGKPTTGQLRKNGSDSLSRRSTKEFVFVSVLLTALVSLGLVGVHW